MRILFLFFLICLLFFSSFSQPVKKGDIAPEIKLSYVFQGPPINDITIHNLKGKVVVLEFWATWCPPCIGAFPHMNRLVEQFEGKDVKFISISIDEGNDAVHKIRYLLSGHPLHTWIVKDGTANSTRTSYGIYGLPATVIIDKAGRISSYILPEELTEKLLNLLLSEKPVTSTPEWSLQESLSATTWFLQ
jgi:thiol-disulfide isomerase/thioredoxin